MKRMISAFFFMLPALFLAAEQPVKLEYNFDGKYSYTERTNLSKYVNGKYIGLTHREIRANMSYEGESPRGSLFSGFFYVTEETLRDMRSVSLPLDEVIPAGFAVSGSGNLVFEEDNGYPRMRNFPAFPEGELRAGDYWEAEAVRVVDPRNDGKTTEMPIHVAYTFSGRETYRDKPVYRIKAKYATRIGKYSSVRTLDANLKEAHGTHDVDILVDAESGAVLMILDRMDETFHYTGGESVRFRGSSAAFTELAVSTEKGVLPRAINRVAQAARDSARNSGVSMPASADDTFGGDGSAGAPGTDSRRPGGGSSGISGRTGTASAGAQGPGAGSSGTSGSSAVASAAGAPGTRGGSGSPGGSGTTESGRRGGTSRTSGGTLSERIAGRTAGRTGTVGGSSSGRTTAGTRGGQSAANGDQEIGEPFTVDVTEQGIRLSVPDIRFKPDSDEILPQEKWRLDAIAETLKLAEGMTFLVEGHTASVGKPNGEKTLSELRAKRITEEMSSRGIPAESFLYMGHGGTKPVADNATAEGRAANRRVEITILGAE